MRAFLWGIVLVPIFYYVALIGGSLTWPGYSHVTQYASELGSAEAPVPALFNLNIIAAGLAAIVGSVGLRWALMRLSGAGIWAMLAAIALAMWGVGMIFGGWFPMPDERHGGYGLALGGQLVPLFALLAARRIPDAGAILAFLAIVFVGSAALLAIMMGVGGLVTTANVGLWQRANSAVSILWLAVLGIWLLARTRHLRAGAS